MTNETKQINNFNHGLFLGFILGMSCGILLMTLFNIYNITK